MRKALTLTMVPILLLTAYMTLWPVPVEPVAWQAPAAPGYAGAHAANDRLAAVQPIDLHGAADPEYVVQGPDGLLYASVTGPGSGTVIAGHMGRVVRFQPDGSALEMVAATGGRPLGLAFDAHGTLLVADAFQGLLAIRDGKPVPLAPGHFANAVTVAANGKIYFTDSSTRFTAAQWGSTLEAAMLDALEQSATGRVLEFDPATAKVRVVATGLSFANGLVLTRDESALLVSESARYRVWKIDLAADAVNVAAISPQATVVLDNLPGYPDNLTRGSDGRIWLGLAGERNDLDAMAQRPFLRRMVLRVPRALWKTPPSRGHVLAFTEEGAIVADLQDASGASPLTTGATEAAGRLYIHNIGSGQLGWLPAPYPVTTLR